MHTAKLNRRTYFFLKHKKKLANINYGKADVLSEVELRCSGRVAFPAPKVARRVSIVTNAVPCVQF